MDEELGICDAGMRVGTSDRSTSGGSESESETSSTRGFIVNAYANAGAVVRRSLSRGRQVGALGAARESASSGDVTAKEGDVTGKSSD